jgi:hypothetical protein
MVHLSVEIVGSCIVKSNVWAKLGMLKLKGNMGEHPMKETLQWDFLNFEMTNWANQYQCQTSAFQIYKLC